MQTSWELACRLSEVVEEAGGPLYSHNYRFSTKRFKAFLLNLMSLSMSISNSDVLHHTLNLHQALTLHKMCHEHAMFLRMHYVLI